MLIVNDVELTSHVGGTTIKRPSVGDAGRGGHFPATCAWFSTAAYSASKGLKKRHLGYLMHLLSLTWHVSSPSSPELSKAEKRRK